MIAQAQSEDVVVFHYSGHGARMLDPDPVSELGSIDHLEVLSVNLQTSIVRLTNSVRGIGSTQFAAISAMVEVVDESAIRD